MIIKCTKKQWLDAAAELIRTKSVEHVKVEPLAASLGVTKGSFYWHFSDQQDLINAVVERHVKEPMDDPVKHIELHNSLMFAARYRPEIRDVFENFRQRYA